MKGKINDGGAAFPNWGKDGMTYRQWLAGMALQGLLACPETTGNFEAFTDVAVKYADALIAELAKGEQS